MKVGPQHYVRLVYAQFFTAAALLVLTSVVGLRTSVAANHPDTASFCVGLAIIAGIPLLYWVMMVRKRVVTRRSTSAIVALAILSARLILPSTHRSFVGGMRYFTIPLELFLIIYLVVAVRRAMQRASRQDGTSAAVDAVEVIEDAVGRFLGGHAFARAVAAEASMLYYALGGGGPISTHLSDQGYAVDSSGRLTIVVGFILVIAIEAVVTDLVLIQHHLLAAGVLSALSLYSALWLIGDYRARRLRLVTINDGHLAIRVGLHCTAKSPVANIKAVQLGRMPRIEGDRTVIDATRPSDSNVFVTFSIPVAVQRAFGIRSAASTIMLRLRDPQRFVAAFATGPLIAQSPDASSESNGRLNGSSL